MKDIAIYGAGGYGKEVACLIRAINKVQKHWTIIGYIDDGLPTGTSNEYGKVLGGIEVLNNWGEQLDVVIAIGNPAIQKRIVDSLINSNLEFPNILAPDVRYLDLNMTNFGIGNIIGFNCIISCYVEFGNYNVLNSDVLIGHDVKVGDFNVFNPSVRISGNVTIGNANLFGVSSIILQNRKIGNYTTISTNSVVMRNTQDNSTYLGNPAIKMKF